MEAVVPVSGAASATAQYRAVRSTQTSLLPNCAIIWDGEQSPSRAQYDEA